MEFKDHAGPVYALHRVFTLNDVDWPDVGVRWANEDSADAADARRDSSGQSRNPQSST
jgi:hypothetical protein